MLKVKTLTSPTFGWWPDDPLLSHVPAATGDAVEPKSTSQSLVTDHYTHYKEPSC